MIVPGKNRCIGAEHPGSERFASLVANFNLQTMRGMVPAEFLRRTEAWGSKDVYDRWLETYRAAGSRTFLEHVAWGADRDLGGGHYLWGAMDDRFATNAARLFGDGGLDTRIVEGKRCLVVGAWDGTECLLLRALGAVEVDAMDEVPIFCEMARLQYEAWEVPGRVLQCSLYEASIEALWQRYDLVYVPGVLYHLSDVPAALVMLWSFLRPGGVLAFESMIDPGAERSARYLGASAPGWNWWAPTKACYEAMLRDCGFPDGRTAEVSGGRGWWVGTKAESLPALEADAAGFSRPEMLRTIRWLASH